MNATLTGELRYEWWALVIRAFAYAWVACGLPIVEPFFSRALMRGVWLRLEGRPGKGTPLWTK